MEVFNGNEQANISVSSKSRVNDVDSTSEGIANDVDTSNDGRVANARWIYG